MALTDVLLAIITALVTVTLTIIGALYRELILNLKPDVQKVRSVLFGIDEDKTDDGLVDDIAEVKEKIEVQADERRDEHQEVETRLGRMQTRLDSVVDALHSSDNVDINVETNHGTEDD